MLFDRWEFKKIAGQLHRKKGKKVYAMGISGWQSVPKEMWWFGDEGDDDVIKRRDVGKGKQVLLHGMPRSIQGNS